MAQNFRGVQGKQRMVTNKSQPLSPTEICEYIDDHNNYITNSPPTSEPPPSGSIILYDKNLVGTERIRNDGYLWETKMNGKVNETHATPKEKGVVLLHGYYAYLKADENFQRRIYWKAEGALNTHIALVQYLVVNKGSRKRKKAKYEQGSSSDDRALDAISDEVQPRISVQADFPQSELTGPNSGINHDDQAAGTESSLISPVEEAYFNMFRSCIGDDGDNDGHDITANNEINLSSLYSANSNDIISIEEFSPHWAHEYTAEPVLICGTFPNSSQLGESYQWSCVFGEYEVDAEYLPKSGSLSCFTPQTKAGWVTFYVKRRLKTTGLLACSEGKEFEFRARQNQVIDYSRCGNEVTQRGHTSVELASFQGHQNHAGYLSDTANVSDISPPNLKTRKIDCAEMLELVQAESQGSNEIVVDGDEDSDGQNHDTDAMQILRSKMAAKRFLTDSVSDQDRSNDNYQIKRSRVSCAFEIGKVVMVNSMQNSISSWEPFLRRVVREEIDRSLIRSPSLRIQALEPSSLSLTFAKSLSLPIFTASKISDKDNNQIQILVVDKNMISGSHKMVPISLPHPIKVEIVVLDGDFPSGDRENWTSKEFDNCILMERTGKRPLLTGDDVTSTVRDGFATIADIEFTDNSSWIRSRKFRLGARVASGTGYQGPRIREAMTEAFVVKDHRGELYKKHYPPMLEDEVWRLNKIGKEGAFHRKLAAENIHTVQDFLKMFVVDRLKLKKILGIGMSEKMWEVTVKHARTCVMGNRHYIFRGPHFELYLSPICQVMKVVINGQTFPARDLSNSNRNYIENLVREAHANWNTLEVVNTSLNETALLTEGHVDDQPYP